MDSPTTILEAVSFLVSFTVSTAMSIIIISILELFGKRRDKTLIDSSKIKERGIKIL